MRRAPFNPHLEPTIFASTVSSATARSPVDFEPNFEWDRFLAQA